MNILTDKGGVACVFILILIMANGSLIVSLTRVKYSLTISFLLENVGDSTITYNIGCLGPKVYLIPTIEGWQELADIIVLVNGHREEYVISTDGDGNTLVKLRNNMLIRRGESVNITVIQEIWVYWSLMGLGFIRKRAVLPQSLSFSISEVPSNMSKYAYLNEKWSWWLKGENKEFFEEKLHEILSRANTKDLAEVIRRISLWVNTYVEDEQTSDNVKTPIETLHKMKGTCMDQAFLISAALRYYRIPAVIAYSIVYREGTYKINLSNYEEEYVNVYPHAFVMCWAPTVGWFPIDTAYNAQDPIGGAAINVFDNVIILAKMVESNPVEFLSYPLPSDNVNLKVKIMLVKTSNPLITLALICLALIALTFFLLKIARRH